MVPIYFIDLFLLLLLFYLSLSISSFVRSQFGIACVSGKLMRQSIGSREEKNLLTCTNDRPHCTTPEHFFKCDLIWFNLIWLFFWGFSSFLLWNWWNRNAMTHRRSSTTTKTKRSRQCNNFVAVFSYSNYGDRASVGIKIWIIWLNSSFSTAERRRRRRRRSGHSTNRLDKVPSGFNALPLFLFKFLIQNICNRFQWW